MLPQLFPLHSCVGCTFVILFSSNIFITSSFFIVVHLCFILYPSIIALNILQWYQMKETQLVQLIRKNITLFHWMRIETTTVQGFPDLIGIAPQSDTIFVECKIARGDTIRLTPHQVSMNLRLWDLSGGCSYLIVHQATSPLGEGVFLYEGSRSLHLTKNGVHEPPTTIGWSRIVKHLQSVHGSRTTSRELFKKKKVDGSRVTTQGSRVTDHGSWTV